jgi:2-polyprenyl-3-methyl-5-hydroxy-6-metoxy-1,4-benzoquinol methylase
MPDNNTDLKKPLEFQLFIDGNRVTIQDYNLHLNRYRFASGFTGDKICLDIGCGCGYGAAYLARKGARKVTGGDKSPEAVALAQKTFRNVSPKLLEFRLLEATELPFTDNSVDTVVCFEVIEHLENYEQLLCEVRRVLKNGGKLILSTPNRKAGCYFLKLPYHVHEFAEEELVKTVNRTFAKSIIYSQETIRNQALLLRRIRFTLGRLLDMAGLQRLELWLGRHLFRHNRQVVYRTGDFDNFTAEEGKVQPVKKGYTPVTFVLVAPKD